MILKSDQPGLMLAESEQLISFVQVGPSTCKNDVVSFGQTQSAQFSCWVELGGFFNNFPGDVMLDISFI